MVPDHDVRIVVTDLDNQNFFWQWSGNAFWVLYILKSQNLVLKVLEFEEHLKFFSCSRSRFKHFQSHLDQSLPRSHNSLSFENVLGTRFFLEAILTQNVQIVSGFLSAEKGWRFTFWFGVFFAAVSWAPLTFLPETFGPILLTERAVAIRSPFTKPRLLPAPFPSLSFLSRKKIPNSKYNPNAYAGTFFYFKIASKNLTIMYHWLIDDWINRWLTNTQHSSLKKKASNNLPL